MVEVVTLWGGTEKVKGAFVEGVPAMEESVYGCL